MSNYKGERLEQRHCDQTHAQEMFEKVERFLANGLWQTEFCRQVSLGYYPCRYWLNMHHLKKRCQLLRPELRRFHPLRVAPNHAFNEPDIVSNTGSLKGYDILASFLKDHDGADEKLLDIMVGCLLPLHNLQIQHKNRIQHRHEQQCDERGHGETADLRVAERLPQRSAVRG